MLMVEVTLSHIYFFSPKSNIPPYCLSLFIIITIIIKKMFILIKDHWVWHTIKETL